MYNALSAAVNRSEEAAALEKYKPRVATAAGASNSNSGNAGAGAGAADDEAVGGSSSGSSSSSSSSEEVALPARVHYLNARAALTYRVVLCDVASDSGGAGQPPSVFGLV